MLDYFKNGKKYNWNICAAYAEGAVTDWTCQKWFAKFCTGDFSVDNVPQLGRPVEVDSDQIKILIENNQHYTIWEITNILEISKSSFENNLHQLGYVICCFSCLGSI